MTILASILLFALSRAELIDRLSVRPVTQVDGLVKILSDCPQDMRREFQTPILRFASDTMDHLYNGLAEPRKRFETPGIVIYIGDGRTNNTEVVTKVDGSVTKLYLPAPGFTDINKLKIELTKAFALSVRGEVLDDGGAVKLYRRADPYLRVVDDRESIEKWMKGEEKLETEEGLNLMRRILEPGRASPRDVKTFASHLYLYPLYYSAPFAGRYHNVSFKEAIDLAKIDPAVRFAALEKSYVVMVYGGGKGDKLSEAAEAYSLFLRELAAGKLKRNGLIRLLGRAEIALHEAAEEARKAFSQERE